MARLFFKMIQKGHFERKKVRQKIKKNKFLKKYIKHNANNVQNTRKMKGLLEFKIKNILKLSKIQRKKLFE